MTNMTDLSRRDANRIAIGAWFVLAGTLLLLQQVGVLHVGGLGRLWPLLLVGLGLARLAVARDRDGRETAFWLLVVGGLFSIDRFLGYRVHHTWPVFVVAAGVSLVWSAFGNRREVPAATEDGHV
jgi:hypothetical protein